MSSVNMSNLGMGLLARGWLRGESYVPCSGGNGKRR